MVYFKNTENFGLIKFYSALERTLMVLEEEGGVDQHEGGDRTFKQAEHQNTHEVEELAKYEGFSGMP